MSQALSELRPRSLKNAGLIALALALAFLGLSALLPRLLSVRTLQKSLGGLRAFTMARPITSRRSA